MKKFEYRIFVIQNSAPDEIELKLNAVGFNGWELVQVLKEGGYEQEVRHAYCKRELV